MSPPIHYTGTLLDALCRHLPHHLLAVSSPPCQCRKPGRESIANFRTSRRKVAARVRDFRKWRNATQSLPCLALRARECCCVTFDIGAATYFTQRIGGATYSCVGHVKSLRPSVKITRIGKPKRYHHVVGYLMHSHNNLYQMDMAAQIVVETSKQDALFAFPAIEQPQAGNSRQIFGNLNRGI